VRTTAGAMVGNRLSVCLPPYMMRASTAVYIFDRSLKNGVGISKDLSFILQCTVSKFLLLAALVN